MTETGNQSAAWIESQSCPLLELGSLIAAASAWTEDETELDDLVCGLIDSGRVEVAIGLG